MNFSKEVSKNFLTDFVDQLLCRKNDNGTKQFDLTYVGQKLVTICVGYVGGSVVSSAIKGNGIHSKAFDNTVSKLKSFSDETKRMANETVANVKKAKEAIWA